MIREISPPYQALKSLDYNINHIEDVERRLEEAKAAVESYLILTEQVEATVGGYTISISPDGISIIKAELTPYTQTKIDQIIQEDQA